MIAETVQPRELRNLKVTPRISASPITSGTVIASSLLALVATVLFLTNNEVLALYTVGAFIFCAVLTVVPPFWLAMLLVVLIPFENLITALLGGFDSSGRQWFALWKEALLAIGIFRVLWRNPNRNRIFLANRPVLIWSGFLMLVYCITFIRLPSVPAVFSLDLETRFLGVMVFFMFLELDVKQINTLLRAMVLSVSCIALYGIVQYVWDYDRLLPLMYHDADLYAEGTRRLYSYALSAFDCAYGAVIAILVLFVGAGRLKLHVALPCVVLLIPCLVLTYVRSAYLGLLIGILLVCVVDRARIIRHAVILGIALSLSCAAFVLAERSEISSNIDQRLHSIISQRDGSSVAHKERMEKAFQVISTNPFGIGLGNSGIVQARFAGGVDNSESTENWVLQVGVQTGLLGPFAYLGLTGAILVSLLRTRHYRNSDMRLLRVSAGAVFVAMTAAGIMIPVWDHLLTSMYAWALVGAALAGTSISPPSMHSQPYSASTAR